MLISVICILWSFIIGVFVGMKLILFEDIKINVRKNTNE